MIKLQAFVAVLSYLGGEESLVEKVWGRRKRHFSDSYEKIYQKFRTKDYPKKPFLEL